MNQYTEAYAEYCQSDRQREVLAAVIANGVKGASRKLGVTTRNVERCMALVRRNAELHGYSPAHDAHHGVMPTEILRGRSTFYNREGKPTGQWVKTKTDDAAFAAQVAEWVDRLTESVPPLPPIERPANTDKDLLAVIPMGDPHFGMYAWADEAGDDFDLDTADRLTRGAIDKLVFLSPRAEECLLINLGDFFHADNTTNRTPASGHALDVDTRFDKIMQVAEDCLVYCIRRLLTKYGVVRFWSIAGNHDPHCGSPLARILRAYFKDNPRVKIDCRPGKFNYLRWGKVLIGSTHGDAARPNNLPLLMATDRADDWGKTAHRYWYTGHIHHKEVKEHPGCIVEAFRTMASRDAWHAGMGYRAGRDMCLIVHHKNYGETVRVRCDISMVE